MPDHDKDDITARIIMGSTIVGGMVGALVTGLVVGLAAVPVAVAALGYSMSGWLGAAAGLVAGAMINFTPFKRAQEEKPLPPEQNTDVPLDLPAIKPIATRVKDTSVSDIASDIGAVGGGLVFAFTGAAVGAVLATIVYVSETRQATYNRFRDPPPPPPRA